MAGNLRVGLAGVLVALLVACGPAAEPAPTTTTAQQPTTTETKPTAAKPAETKPAETKPAAAKPAETKPAAVKPAETKPAAAKPTKSISGIPLDPNAKFGGVLRAPTSGFGASFNTWEERSGGPEEVYAPLSNAIVTTQTWWTDNYIETAAYSNVVPDLAQSWEQSSDGLRWVFKFRDGVKWADGKPFTCADAQWMLDSMRTGQGLRRSPTAIHLLAIDNVQCADDLTMVINMKKPKPGLLSVIAYPFHLVRPKHIYENNTAAMREKPPVDGTGPFTLSQLIPGEKAVLARKTGYWDQPFPYLDGIEVLILSAASEDAGVRAGRVDISSNGYGGGRLRLLQQGCKDCVFYAKFASPGIDAVMVNHQRPPWNDPLIKDAISYAIDRDSYNQLVYLGDRNLLRGGLFPIGSPFEMPYERVKQIPGYNFEDPQGNRRKAQELIAQAGYRPGELQLDLEVWKTLEDRSVPIIEYLTAIGIVVKPYVLETALHYEAMSAGDFDVAIHGFAAVTDDPDEVFYEHFYTGSDRNYNRYSNPEVDRLIDQMSVTVDPELRKQRAWDLAETVLREHGKHALTAATWQAVHGPRLRGFAPAPLWLSRAGYRRQHVWLAE